jgi:RNA polymerase sigma factor (sigma-70 family)
MMTNTMFQTETDDAALVAECLAGNRHAFGSIVQRYQSLICALAYNATGSLSQSEDLAQETFLTAWRQLAGLREPAKLRPWLCRIARNLSFDALRRQGREPMDAAEPLEAAQEVHAHEPSPSEATMTREEDAILWRSLEHLPGACREPLILFYREHRSIESVAASLELSEDAVKQRLSRGRKLLAEQVLAFVEGALERTGPGPAFAQGVMMALPAMTATTTTTALAGTTVKGGATAKAATTGLLWTLWAAVLVIFGNYASYRASLAMASSEGEKHYIKGFYARLVIGVIGFSVALSLLIWWGVAQGQSHHGVLIVLVLALAGGCVLTFLGLGFWSWRKNRALDCIRADGPRKVSSAAWEYRSPVTFLGLPLIHIRVGGPCRGKDAVVKAWFAAGGCAMGGLFAFGGLAIAPFSIGGCALGLISWGGTSMGLLAVGGLAVGGWSWGALAIGWNAYGGCAVAWKAAVGGAAVAHGFALGSIPQGAQAGDEAAKSYVASSQFFQWAQWGSRHAGWLNLIWVLPLVAWWGVAERARRRSALTALLAAGLFVSSVHHGLAQDAPQSTNAIPERFDNLVRDDYFSGDPARFQRAMKVCDDALAKNPRHAPALAWRGSGDLTLAGKAFQTNDVPTGIRLWQKGLKEMDDAVAMQPESLQVIIPRGAVYLSIAKYDPNPDESKHLLQTGVADYEKTLLRQQPTFDKLSRHARGELLFGLADGWCQLGDLDKARGYLQRITNVCPDSVYSRRAEDWLAAKDAAALKEKSRALSCVGCHGG